MGDLSVINSHEFVMLSGDELVTDSRRVAKHFGKRHDSVLRSIRNTIKSAGDFGAHNFVECFENNTLANGRRDRFYTMTKDGFTILAMGFNGDKAMEMKISFINAFNQMAEQLKRRDMGLWQQMQAQIAKEVDSQVRASFGSHLMLRRKREIPKLQEERVQLEHKIQPSLFGVLN